MWRIPVDKFPVPRYEDKEVIKAWKWFMSFISEKEWQRRKAAIESQVSVEFRQPELVHESLTEGTLLVVDQDKIGWYLYLLDVLINEPHKYEYFQGARIVPIFKRIGMDFDALQYIGGLDKKVKDLIHKRPSEADAILFEILTALLWVRNGWQVNFLTESKTGKMPDLFVEKGPDKWQVECKRQRKTADYTYKETEKRQKMISYISETLREHNILLHIDFHVELNSLPDTYLKDTIKEKIPLLVTPGKIVSNEQVDIEFVFVDIQNIKEHLLQYSVKSPSPQSIALIAKELVDNRSFTSGMKAEFFRVGDGSMNNLYISDIEKAYGVIWRCDAKEALMAKARDVKNQIYEAIKQFSPDSKGILHIGIETFDGPEVEMERAKKISNTLKEINPYLSNLRWIYCHYFQSYSTLSEIWVFDETVTTISPYINPKSPLHSKLLIVPDENGIEDTSHWMRPLPK